MESQNKKKSLRKGLKNFIITNSILTGVFLISSIVFFILYFTLHNFVFLVVGSILAFLFGAAVCVISIIFYLNSYKKVFFNLFETTLSNYKAGSHQNRELKRYNGPLMLEEFEELNTSVGEFEKAYEDVIISNGKLDYESMSLWFVDDEKDVVSFSSFKENIIPLINKSENFRNAFILISYPLGNNSLLKEERKYIRGQVREIFDYENLLMGEDQNQSEMIIFVPRFDSLNKIKEDVDSLLRKISVSRILVSGVTPITPTASVVVYPYSNDDEIIADLRYAARQGKQINFYLPKKKKHNVERVKQSSRNINNVSFILEKLATINGQALSLDSMTEEAKNAFSAIADYYCFDAAGFFAYEELDNRYDPVIVNFRDADASLMDFGKVINKEFAECLNKVKDADNSYYFSQRKHLSKPLANLIDKYGIESGYFYVSVIDGRANGIFYFVNKKPATLDIYLLDSLLSFCHAFCSLSDAITINKSFENTNDTLNKVLKLTNYCVYSIDRRTLTIHSYSDTMKNIAPGIKKDIKCYEAIFGEKNKCRNCPLRTGRKMIQKIGDNHYQVSTTLTDPNSKEVKFLLSPASINGTPVAERFDPEFLTDSFYAFMENMAVMFSTKQKGQLLVLNIDNSSSLLAKFKISDYNAWVRMFIESLKKEKVNIGGIYSVSNRVFIVSIPNLTRNDVVDYVENAYLLSKKEYLAGSDSVLNVTYSLYSYPQGFQSSEEYVRSLLNISITPENYMNKDMLFVPELKYQRPAYHKEFVLDILENSLNKNTFSILFQPLVNGLDRKITSAEMLLRLSDTFLGNVVNTFEVIMAASENKKIPLITDILIDYIGFIYTEYGEKLFKKYDVLHLSLNTDYSFFEDLEFITKINGLKTKLGLPDDFLVFEIRENEIAKYYSQFSLILKTLVKNKINLVCDNYTGRDLSIEKLHNIGFSGIKIDRSLVSKVAEDQMTLESIRQMLETAEKENMKATLVGVETKEQYAAIKTINNPYGLQGYYFYRPMDVERFITELFRSK